MSGRKEKKAALEEKLQLLRSITNSNATNKTSILVDASKYIKELKDKVEEASAADSSSSSSGSAMAATVSVSSVELMDSNSSCSCRRGFRITCPWRGAGLGCWCPCWRLWRSWASTSLTPTSPAATTRPSASKRSDHQVRASRVEAAWMMSKRFVKPCCRPSANAWAMTMSR